ncbi:protein kinase [Streptomyces sp. bgisy060]|uniref:protein kinase n=1 Tax=Streptomyces sp. bgisy060 TaxID=3413775 RepID=UPI003EB8665A
MDDYAGRVLADRYRLPLPPADADAYAPVETRAFDTYSGQEVLVRQVPLPEFVDAEVLDDRGGPPDPHGAPGRTARRPAEPLVRRAIEAAQAAAQIPDHPLLDQVFDVFAEAGSLWIVSERVAARPLAALLAERPLNPYRAAEIGADVLTALRALHAHGWVHRNITSRTVLVCDDGRVLLTGLAVGAAEEALCGYAPVPEGTDALDSGAYDTGAYDDGAGGAPEPVGPAVEQYAPEAGGHGGGGEEYGGAQYGVGGGEEGAGPHAGGPHVPAGLLPAPAHGPPAYDTPAYDTPAYDTPAYGAEVLDAEAGGEAGEGGTEGAAPEPHAAEPGTGGSPGPVPDAYGSDPYGRAEQAVTETQPAATPPTADVRAARAGAIAAYRAGARAAARLGETGALPVQRPAPQASPEPPPPPTAQAPGAPEPQWWARVADEDDDEDDEEPRGGGPTTGPPPRMMLAGSWSDGPHAARDGSGPIPAGGGSGPGNGPVLPGSGRPALPAGYTAATPGATPLPVAAGTGEEAPLRIPARERAEEYRGPTTRLAAERARQTRIAVVGAVTERWAPEQAGPVHENWRLAPPIGPATDLWALGALLYRAVQGHAPYPEDSAAELVQLVCAEPPAFAEDSGPLRPVVESLLRQDPTERPDFEELRGWLRSLVRSAPEPEVGLGAVPPSAADGARLPIVRRRGELVRRWRKGAGSGRHRHKRREGPRAKGGHQESHGQEHAAEYAPEYARDGGRPHPLPDHHEGFPDDHGGAFPEDFGGGFREESGEPLRDGFREDFDDEIPQRAARAPRSSARPASARAGGSPRALGRTLLTLVFLLLVGALAYALLFMPGKDGEPTAPAASATAPATTSPTTSPSRPSTSTEPSVEPTEKPVTTPPATGPSAPELPAGYAVRQDPEGFRIGVPKDWRRSPINDAGQVRYSGGDFTLIVVPGRDSVQGNGSDPLEYQNSKERELEPWRSSSWSRAEKARRVDIGRTPTAEGHYTWLDSTGREVFVRNLALIDGGRYYVVQVIGPESERDKVSEVYEQATKAFRPGR